MFTDIRIVGLKIFLKQHNFVDIMVIAFFKNLSSFKDSFDVVQKILASAAIIAAAGWFFFRFEHFPRANITQAITSACFSKGIRWVRTDINVENRGNARLVLGTHRHRIANITPPGLPDVESEPGKIVWSTLASFDIENEKIFLESNESQKLHYDFLIPDQVSMIESIVFFENLSASKENSKVGWADTSVFPVPEEPCK